MSIPQFTNGVSGPLIRGQAAHQTFLSDIEMMSNPHSIMLHTQSNRNVDVLVEVVDERGRIINHPYARLHAVAEMGTISCSGDSHVRRTGQLTLKLIRSLAKGAEEVFWMTNRIRIYMGMQDLTQSDPHYVYYLMGTFYVTTENVSFDPEASRINLAIQDLSAALDREQINYELVLEPGLPVTTVVTMLIEDYLTDHIIQPSINPIPHTMRFPIGTNVIDILNQLRDLYMDHLFYFDIQGRFRFHRYDIQRPETMPVRWRFIPGQTDLRITYGFSANFQEVRNKVEVFGQMSDTGFYPRSSAWINNPESPFHESKIGERKRVLLDNSIRTELQADALARWTLFHESQRQQVMDSQCVPIWYLDTLEIIEIPNENTGEFDRYEIRGLNYNLSHDQPMSINARRVYSSQFDVESENQDHMQWVQLFRNGIIHNGWWQLAENKVISTYGLQVIGMPIMVVNFEHSISERTFVLSGFTEWTRQALMFNVRHFQNATGEHATGAYMMDGNRVVARAVTMACLQSHWGATKFRNIPMWFRQGLGLNISGARPYLRHILTDENTDVITQARVTNLKNRALGLFRGGIAGILSDNDILDMAGSFILTRFFEAHLLQGHTLRNLIESLYRLNSGASVIMTDALLENMPENTWSEIEQLLEDELDNFIREQWLLNDPIIPGNIVPNVISNVFDMEVRSG